MKEKPPSLTKLQTEVIKFIKEVQLERKHNKMSYKATELLKKVFSSETKGGRIARTALQAFIGLVSGFGFLLAIPELQAWFATLPLVVQLGGLASVITLVATVQNYAKDLWESVKG